MVKKLQEIKVDTIPNSVYGFNGFTLQELLSQFYNKINEVVEIAIESFNFLEFLKNEGVPIEVAKELQKMYDDGRLKHLIDELSQNTSTKINELDEKLTTLIENNYSELSGEINNIKNEVLTSLVIDGGVL